MKLAIIGSRTFNNYELMKTEVFPFINCDIILSGGAKGADNLAEKFAHQNNKKIVILKPQWHKFGKSAGLIRNIEIVKQSDLIIAFWNGQSKGTKHSIDTAKKMKKRIITILY